MRWLVILASVVMAYILAGSGLAATCTKEEFGKAVDGAGDALRKLNADNAPRLRAKLRLLKEARRWPDAGFEERAFALLQDERTAALDRTANDLLTKLDQLGTVEPGAEPDCAQLQELTAISLELQATVKAKAAYTLGKIDQMLSPAAALPAGDAKTDAKADAKPEVKAESGPAEARAPPAVAGEPKGRSPRPAAERGWSTQTKGEPSSEVAMAPPPAPSPGAAEEEGYSIEEILAASEGLFGKVSANLGAVIEHLFVNSGRPTAYVLGSEGGGAFLAGVRYGNGTLYRRAVNATQKIYWHGPSLGTDVGADGSKTLFLIYKMKEPEALYATFTGIDGSAYLVGGVGATLVTNGKVVMAPIRSGVGLRLGANVGYIRFTPHATWNPF
jgi:hypothetical protein